MSGGWEDGGDWSSGFAYQPPEPDPMEDFFDNSVEYHREDPEYDKPEVLLFVVGTEKKGYKDHHLLGANAEYLGKYHTESMELRLFKNIRDMPFVGKGEHSLIGELYQIPGEVLKELDKKYNLHTRDRFNILDEDDNKEEAWLYHMVSPVVVNFDIDPDRIEQGIRVVNETRLEFLA